MGWFSIRRISHTRRRPRDGYIRRMIHRLRRILRDLLYYARKHPIKSLLLVILPLVTGSALQKVLRILGIRLPGSSARGAISQESATGRATLTVVSGFGDSHSSRGGMSKNLGNIASIASLASGGGIGVLLKIAQSLM